MNSLQSSDLKIGVIGQGWVGKHFADELESRGYRIARYSKEEPFLNNLPAIKECNVLFLAVPTPTVNGVTDIAAVEDALRNISAGSIVVIKSTILPGTTEILQKKFSELYVMHSPEFLREKTAAQDVAHPERNIIGIPSTDPECKKKAELVMSLLPRAPYEKVLPAKEAEMVKYAGNCFLFTKVVFMNLLFELSEQLGVSYEDIREAVSKDSRIGESHTFVVDDKGGRGAGGNCFIKDFSAFESFFSTQLPLEEESIAVLRALCEKNKNLLMNTSKDLGILGRVYPELVQAQEEIHA